MPTYDYECTTCGYKFERFQHMQDKPLSSCPQCGWELRRLVGGGAGIIVKGGGTHAEERSKECSFEKSGQTCCGRDERCGKPPCKDKP